jgi:hypothetical protein
MASKDKDVTLVGKGNLAKVEAAIKAAQAATGKGKGK